MSELPAESEPGLPPELVDLVRTWFGPRAEEVLEAIRQSGMDPNALLEAMGLTGSRAEISRMVKQIAHMIQTGSPDGAINWDLAHDAARKASLLEGADPVVAASQTAVVDEAFKVADLWLDQATEFTSTGRAPVALSAAGWVEATLPRWRQVTTPVANSLTRAMTSLMERHAQEHPAAAETARDTSRVLLPMVGSLFGLQLGQALGQLSREVFGYTDTGLPLADPGTTAMLPAAVKSFADDLQLPDTEVRLFLAARESAHARLFRRVPWLADHLYGAVEAYASEISIDLERLEAAFQDADMNDPRSLRDAISSGVVAPALTERQRSALDRLETALALVEGWVDQVTQSALDQNLPDLNSLREMTRRRRAEGGPAEHTLATLVGLELRPRRARQASELWQSVTDRAGPAGREAVWSHPDLLPGSDDLDHPEAFWDLRQARLEVDAAFDAEVAAFLDQPAAGEAARPDAGPDADSGAVGPSSADDQDGPDAGKG
ncbi:MAG: zinc-dependent metalloprotease [Bifidobacteriaceae bacterium]|nr:zinc-dependent metalloprotease [Bifidobacteriaceae bacterium]